MQNSKQLYKSQKRQDRWVLEEVLPGKIGGFFLDLAAADGVTHSNTYVLEKQFRWSGICIEPNPDFFKALKAERNCICNNSVVSDKIEFVKFRVDNGQLGGIVSEDTDNSYRIRGDQLAKADIISLKTDTLANILQKNNAPETIDYFSLDVEGAEERIISSFDFSKYRFLCITVERPTPKVNSILFDNGYVFVKNYCFDSFYVHPEIAKTSNIHCEQFEQIPPKDW
ncbi:FkbM family methyltransferase [Oceanidesulfovibrio indonesiensis]|uniref:FkbM family methyltransferase n=1 Tax=Oceanidesulfovibrio indonesiensis TaxID=54767 RepID=A0A7M3MBT2_9BACT|nr:FkbM family methyltransferase [Oceanidesulfovibrio indonesiensis]TVM15205.1 FkbM family methyltransferase [Oceanidesulfovibrio indonesiensis]